jgi:hypothetical protein
LRLDLLSISGAVGNASSVSPRGSTFIIGNIGREASRTRSFTTCEILTLFAPSAMRGLIAETRRWLGIGLGRGRTLDRLRKI